MRHDQSRSHPPRSDAQRPLAQPCSKLADQLERITSRFDELTHRARLGAVGGKAHADLLHDLEELAQGIARDLVATFRGPGARVVNPPLQVSADGTKAVW
jgi:hypothetical protein